METPLVSICCITYNHEHYIKDALDGFITQKTTFPFEIVISDDCSKDNTRQIIAEYKSKYPKLFRDVSPNHNLGAFVNFQYVQDQALGKYVAICEGDDYWTDANKLQKQVDFLESHPDFSMCCHGADVKNETERPVDCACENMTTREYYPNDAFPTWQIPTASIVYRREAVMRYKLSRVDDFDAMDVVLLLRCMTVGRAWGFADHMSVYRMNPGGLTSRKWSANNQLKQCNHYLALIENFPQLDAEYCHRFIAMVYYSIFRKPHDGISPIYALWVATKHCPLYVLRKILKIPTKPRNDLFYQHYRL